MPVSREVEALILKFARENRSWDYDRIAGALLNLGHSVSDTTIANVLKRNGLPTAYSARTAEGNHSKEFVHSHMDRLFATDFFTTEVWSCFGLVTYYILLFIHIGTRRVHIGGITRYPHQGWMAQISWNLTDAEDGFLVQNSCRYLIHDRDSKF